MKKEPLPLLYHWIRGAIGKQFVIKHYKYGPVKTRYPDMTKIIASAEQRKCRNLFKEAVAYAKTVIADPVKKAEWQKRIRIKSQVFVKVIREYMLEAKRVVVKRAQATERLIRRSLKVACDTIQVTLTEGRFISKDLNSGHWLKKCYCGDYHDQLSTGTRGHDFSFASFLRQFGELTLEIKEAAKYHDI